MADPVTAAIAGASLAVSLSTAGWTIAKDRRALIVREYGFGQYSPRGEFQEWVEVRATNVSLTRSFELDSFGYMTNNGMLAYGDGGPKLPALLGPGQTFTKSWHIDFFGDEKFEGQIPEDTKFLYPYARTTDGRVYRGRNDEESWVKWQKARFLHRVRGRHHNASPTM